MRRIAVVTTLTLALAGAFALGQALSPSDTAQAGVKLKDTKKFEPRSGLVRMRSQHGVAETMDKLQAALEAKGVTIFARIDHAEGAKQAKLKLRPTQVLIFGNPKLGTPLMQASQTAAIDLPQKALVYEDHLGSVYVVYNDPHYLALRHGISEQHEGLQKVKIALDGFTKSAAN